MDERLNRIERSLFKLTNQEAESSSDASINDKFGVNKFANNIIYDADSEIKVETLFEEYIKFCRSHGIKAYGSSGGSYRPDIRNYRYYNLRIL